MNNPGSGDKYRIVVLFTLSGAALGVNLAMLFVKRDDRPYAQTDIGGSTLLTLILSAIGLNIGILIGRLSRPAAWVTVGVLLLTGLLGASMGWLVGEHMTRGRIVLDGAPVPPGQAMSLGGLAGLAVGGLALLPRLINRNSISDAQGASLSNTPSP